MSGNMARRLAGLGFTVAGYDISAANGGRSFHFLKRFPNGGRRGALEGVTGAAAVEFLYTSCTSVRRACG
jgi:hypothetical protein